ncbi:Crp/Fnr family transcriptional regulator [Tenacibaculum agarivorans]|uniref:Crp/Fnr family transcriptional regulator n=1 Tax=Tenacibaculum agarivorans TaxID=1908389 RepID=UPI00094BC251|nr:Crp/Fnr family transcriptional regulator [Tenacibaculum agarivorans]
MNDISETSIDSFSSILKEKEYKSGDFIKTKDVPSKNFYIIESGIMANFTQDIKMEKEYIRSIMFEKHIFMDVSDLGNDNDISTDYFKCLTNSKLFVGDIKDLMSLAVKNQELLVFMHKVSQTSIHLITNRLDRLILLDATERYQILKKRIPDIDNLIPQYQIASYLNITPVQLSRIRKKMYSR